MGRIVIVAAPSAGFAPESVAVAWNADAEASAVGMARVEAAKGDHFFPGLVELVVIPLAVNVASSAVYDLVKELAVRLRTTIDADEPRVEQPEVTPGGTDVIIVIRGKDEVP